MTKASVTGLPETPIAPGKLPPAFLQQILDLPRASSPDVIVGPGLGEDGAVVRMGRRLVALASDPITFPTPRPGFFAIHVNANDIAVMGAKPTYYTLTVILPPGSTAAQAGEIVSDALEVSRELGIVLVGGHTEVSCAVSIPVVSVTMFGELLRPEPTCTGNGQPGDVVVQVNPLGIEGTAILASEYRERLVKELGADLVDRAANFSYDPGLSVVKAAIFASTRLRVHAMHDPTEGGIATGLREIADASGTGVVVRRTALLQREETTQICRLLGHDPLGIISSGCLLISTQERHAEGAVRMFADMGFPASVIGSLTPAPGQYRIENAAGDTEPLPVFAADELVREED